MSSRPGHSCRDPLSCFHKERPGLPILENKQYQINDPGQVAKNAKAKLTCQDVLVLRMSRRATSGEAVNRIRR